MDSIDCSNGVQLQYRWCLQRSVITAQPPAMLKLADMVDDMCPVSIICLMIDDDDEWCVIPDIRFSICCKQHTALAMSIGCCSLTFCALVYTGPPTLKRFITAAAAAAVHGSVQWNGNWNSSNRLICWWHSYFSVDIFYTRCTISSLTWTI